MVCFDCYSDDFIFEFLECCRLSDTTIQMCVLFSGQLFCNKPSFRCKYYNYITIFISICVCTELLRTMESWHLNVSTFQFSAVWGNSTSHERAGSAIAGSTS